MTDFSYETDPLDESEDVVAVFYGGRGQVGQQYVITNRRLLMGPLDVGMALEINAYVLDKTFKGSGTLLKSVLSRYAPFRPTTLWLRHVTSVQPHKNAGLFHPPSLRLTTATGQAFTLGIVATPTTMNLKPENNRVRDRAVQVLREAVASAKEHQPPA